MREERKLGTTAVADAETNMQRHILHLRNSAGQPVSIKCQISPFKHEHLIPADQKRIARYPYTFTSSKSGDVHR